MSDGGFLLKFDDEVVQRCHSVSVDYDTWEYTVNGDVKGLPDDVKVVTIEVEHGE